MGLPAGARIRCNLGDERRPGPLAGPRNPRPPDAGRPGLDRRRRVQPGGGGSCAGGAAWDARELALPGEGSPAHGARGAGSMTEDLETRLRMRLLALSEAVPVEPISATLAAAQRARIGPARPRRRATTLGSLAALVAVLAVLVAVGSRFAGSGGTQASPSAPTASLAAQPSPTASDKLSDLVVSCELAT